MLKCIIRPLSLSSCRSEIEILIAFCRVETERLLRENANGPRLLLPSIPGIDAGNATVAGSNNAEDFPLKGILVDILFDDYPVPICFHQDFY